MKHRFASLLLSALAFSGFVQAQSSFPDKPVRMIVTWSAGGPVDVGARAVGQGLTEKLKQPFIVDNRPGANGIIGTELGVRSPADGYTVIVANVETLALNPHIYPNLKYSPMKDMEPIAMMGQLPLALAVRSELPTSTGEELINTIRRQPGKLTYGSWGIGSIGHLGLAMAEHELKLEMLHVPYQGGAPAQQALMANQIDMLMVQVPFAEQQQKTGKLKLIGVTSKKRSPLYPNVPTLIEQGFTNVSAEQWVAFFVPTGTPAHVKELLQREISGYVSSTKGANALKQIGFDPIVLTPSELTALVKLENDRWGKVIASRSLQSK